MEKVQLSFKIIIVGTQAAGKTSLAYNYVNGGFRGDYTVTVGVEFSSKIVDIENTPIQMQIWDTV
jgi:GTPase SAR1 family protein